MKYEVDFRGKKYEVHAHATVLQGSEPIEEYVSSYIKGGTFYEEPILSYLKDTYDLFDTVIDCGANVGNHAKFFTEVMGAEVWAFEPSEENYRLLVRNNPIGHNHMVALGEKKGAAGLETVPHNMGASRLVQGKGTTVMPLDYYNIAPDLIKIDVEGMEEEVIKGGIKTISKHRPILVVEHNDLQALYRTSRALRGLNYRVEVFSEPTWELFLYLPND